MWFQKIAREEEKLAMLQESIRSYYFVDNAIYIKYEYFM